MEGTWLVGAWPAEAVARVAGPGVGGGVGAVVGAAGGCAVAVSGAIAFTPDWTARQAISGFFPRTPML
jgi:hypothetical protein